MTNGDVVFTARPVFVGWITLLLQLPIQLFLTFWAGGFFGGISSALPLFARGSWVPFLFFGGIAFFGIPAVAYFGKKLNYSRSEYRFFEDKLEFQEGFFSLNKKVIEYRDVKEVTLRNGILQRIYGLGTIYLATLATGSSGTSNPFVALGFGNVSASGVYVRDIQGSDRVFDQIRQLIDRSKK
jgi:membrane protein YdbS with pleckstrin-like domain